MPVPGGRVTPAPEVPTVLNTCQTPTEALPGSPTVAIGIVTTPRFMTGRTDEPEVVLVVVVEVVVADDLSPEHAVAPTVSTASRPTSASRRSHRIKGSPWLGRRPAHCRSTLSRPPTLGIIPMG